jgi:hypothetical protein
MSAGNPPVDLGAEREIDLRRWRDAVVSRWWCVAVGLVIGLVVGGLYSLSGASTYSSTVTIQPAQPFSPTGGAVLNYSSSPLAINVLVSSPSALAYAAKVAHMPAGQLSGHVSTASISTGAGPVATRGTVLIQITVSVPQKLRSQNAANAFGAYVVRQTESLYVRKSLLVYQELNTSFTKRLNTVDALITYYNNALNKAKLLDPIDKLVLAAQLNDAVARQGNLEDALYTNQQAQTLAQNIEVAQVINPALASKVTSRSRRDSVLFGGLIGLLIGLVIALVVGLRRPRPAPAR